MQTKADEFGTGNGGSASLKQENPGQWHFEVADRLRLILGDFVVGTRRIGDVDGDAARYFWKMKEIFPEHLPWTDTFQTVRNHDPALTNDKPFWDSSAFPWIRRVEEKHGAIVAELRKYLGIEAPKGGGGSNELSTLPLSQLRKRARAAGVSAETLEEVLDEANPKAAMAAMILQREPPDQPAGEESAAVEGGQLAEEPAGFSLEMDHKLVGERVDGAVRDPHAGCVKLRASYRMSY